MSERHSQFSARGRLFGRAALLIAALGLVDCAAHTPAPASRSLAPLGQADASWLERVGFGLDSEAVAEYRALAPDPARLSDWWTRIEAWKADGPILSCIKKGGGWLRTAVAFAGARESLSAETPQVQGRPSTPKLSLTLIGTP